MKTTGNFASILVTVGLLSVTGRAEEQLPLLKTTTDTYTNVVITGVSATHVFFQDAAGMSSVKLSDLDPALQKKFGYNPNRPEATASPAYRVARPAGAARVAGAMTGGDPANANPDGGISRGRQTKDFAIGGGSALTLEFPTIWTDSFQPAPTNSYGYATLKLKRPYSEDFLVQLTTIPAGAKLLQSGARQLMTTVGEHALAGSVEQQLELKALDGPAVHGYYFTLTNAKLANVSEPKAGTYKYQTQGLVIIDDFGLNFTVFYNYPSSYDPMAALEMIQSATLSKSAAPLARAEP